MADIKDNQDTPKRPWRLMHREMTKRGLKHSFFSNLQYALGKDLFTTTPHDNFYALALSVRDRLVERWIETQQSYHKKNPKRVYYLSLEFLIGRLLDNNLLNLKLWDKACEACEEMDLDIEALKEEEADAGLGNGGLGRLAACFLDSMATLGIPAHGYGIRYDYGIFNQKIVNGRQIETPDEWLKLGNPWEFEKPSVAVTIKFGGEVVMRGSGDDLHVEWINTQNVVAMPYDVPVTGYQNNVVNTLRLWSAKSSEDFDLDYFNDGDYEKAVYDKIYSENISKVLYPNDSNAMGRELRLKQEYFFTAASIADIIRRFKVDNTDFSKFSDSVAIQLNDTHPALAVAELMRVLLDEEGIAWKQAWDITVKTFAYTNHTVMPEALECWKVPLFGNLLPRHLQIVLEINARFLKIIRKKFPNNEARVQRMSLVAEGHPQRIRMAHLAIVGSHAVNGVSELHTEIIKSQLFKDFYELYPERFSSKTNGITQRRWLLKANEGLSDLITDTIGEGWTHHFKKIKKLERFSNDLTFHEKWRAVKRQNKVLLSNYLKGTAGLSLDPDSLFDVQVKRIHEYKRQTLFAFYMIAEYLKIKENPNHASPSRTFLVGGKAAPGYWMAKNIIHFINAVGDKINHDPTVKSRLKVVFLENYRVSLAEKIFPASDLSEQISTAGTEASGTGCMKFLMNGALTIGTLDGANIEMAQKVREENMYIFGLKEEEVLQLKGGGYHPKTYVDKNPVLQEVFKLVQSNFFSPHQPGLFTPLIESILNSDPYLICADFEDYCRAQRQVDEEYLVPHIWTQKSILNVAGSSKFSSDRTIADYARDIWNVPTADF